MSEYISHRCFRSEPRRGWVHLLAARLLFRIIITIRFAPLELQQMSETVTVNLVRQPVKSEHESMAFHFKI